MYLIYLGLNGSVRTRIGKIGVSKIPKILKSDIGGINLMPVIHGLNPVGAGSKNFEKHRTGKNLTFQGQSSERDLPGTIVP